MKFLCDVHISYKLVNHLQSIGLECIHVNDILNKWNTKDHEICNFADEYDLVVITKDIDFKNSFLLNKTPKKLVKVNLGNISNNRLIQIITDNIDAIRKLNESRSFLLEINSTYITFIQ